MNALQLGVCTLHPLYSNAGAHIMNGKSNGKTWNVKLALSSYGVMNDRRLDNCQGHSEVHLRYPIPWLHKEPGSTLSALNLTLRVQVWNNHILTQYRYYN